MYALLSKRDTSKKIRLQEVRMPLVLEPTRVDIKHFEHIGTTFPAGVRCSNCERKCTGILRENEPRLSWCQELSECLASDHARTGCVLTMFCCRTRVWYNVISKLFQSFVSFELRALSETMSVLHPLVRCHDETLCRDQHAHESRGEQVPAEAE